MRSWTTPKPLRNSSSASKLHHAPLKPTFDIRKHISPTPKDATKNAARYKYKASRLVKEVKEFARSRLSIATDTTAKLEQQPQDLIPKIIFGADKDDNIAAYEQRHQRFLEALKGAREFGGNERIKERGFDMVRRPSSIQNSWDNSATEEAKAPHEKQDGNPQMRRRRSFFAKTESLSAFRRPSTLVTINRQSPGKSRIGEKGFFDAQTSEGSEPVPFVRPNSWSRISLRKVKTNEDRSISKSAIVEEDRTRGSNASQGPLKRLSSENADDTDTHPGFHEASMSDIKKDEDGSQLPLAVNKENKGLWRYHHPSSRAVQRSEFESVGVQDASDMTSEEEKPSKRILKRKVSLFEELFPEEARKESASEKELKPQNLNIPKLSLPVLDEDDSFGDEYIRGRTADNDKVNAASEDAFRSWNPTILVFQVASPSLIDSDFRRIAPKGQHISEWTGPGDYFKGTPKLPQHPKKLTSALTVIPGRDPKTLKQETHYFLVFPNPAYAQTYQKHVLRLHQLARTHTPTSIESPMPPPKGMLIKGEDVHSLLQDYTLCPPSQKPLLVHFPPPLSTELKRLLRNHGYPEITQPLDKTGRSVLFWVEGFVPLLEQVQQLLTRDGRTRGMAWALLNGKDSIQQLDPSSHSSKDLSNDLSNEEEAEGADVDEPAGMEREEVLGERQAFRDYARRTRIRWTIAFEDENEARRFVRRWHLRPFLEAFQEKALEGDHTPLVHAEFLW